MTHKPAVVIYTDGACDPNPGPGGWAALLLYSDHEKVLTGAEDPTTNNRMELTAAIQGSSALKRPCAVNLYTDSEYLKNGITEWLPGWRKRGWRRQGGPSRTSSSGRRSMQPAHPTRSTGTGCAATPAMTRTSAPTSLRARA